MRDKNKSHSTHRIHLSLDTWSVFAAFALAALVRRDSSRSEQNMKARDVSPG